jgi:hypothetical protein
VRLLTIHSYPLPELMDPKDRFSAITYIANYKVRRMIGTVKNVASRELLYAASSDNETFDQRNAVLGGVQKHRARNYRGVSEVALRE